MVKLGRKVNLDADFPLKQFLVFDIMLLANLVTNVSRKSILPDPQTQSEELIE